MGKGLGRATAAADSLNGWTDAFAAHLATDGSRLLYATYLCGSRTDVAHRITLDGRGGVYVAGERGRLHHNGDPACGRPSHTPTRRPRKVSWETSLAVEARCRG